VEAQNTKLGRARASQGSLKLLELPGVAHAEQLLSRQRAAEQDGRPCNGHRRRERVEQEAFLAQEGADLDEGRRGRREENL
jgi:hypothetical protein